MHRALNVIFKKKKIEWNLYGNAFFFKTINKSLRVNQSDEPFG